MEAIVPKAFRDQPWCLSILRDPAFTHVPLHDQSHVDDPFFRKTLHSRSTIRSSISLRSSPDSLSPFQPNEYLILLDVGEDIIGQSGLCHGGFLATLLDEVTGRLLAANGLDQGTTPRTALLNITFKSPVYAPAVILATAKMDKVEGRKLFLSATIQNGQRVVCATADILYVRKKENL